MAAKKNTKRKSPAPKQTKTVKQLPEQITLDDALTDQSLMNDEKKPVDKKTPQKINKNAELKSQRDAIEVAKQASPKNKTIETKKEEHKETLKKEDLKKELPKADSLKNEIVEIPQKHPKQEQALRSQPPVQRTKSNRKKKKRKSEERILKLSLDKNVPFAYSEAYKSLRTNINFISATSDVKSIVFTSAIPQESKSNVAVNTAINMASEGKKVILIDCDLRKPVLHKYLHVGRNHQGLTDVLASRVKLDDCIVKFKDVKVHLLPAGTIPPNPSEMLSQERMKKLIDFLKEQYDFVILDAPPVSVVTDAAVLGHYVDGAILVVRSKFAPKETVQLAKKKLENVDIKILGVVLTRYNAKKSTKNSAYTYSYSYGYGYGYGDENG